jgi:hypothetical protein
MARVAQKWLQLKKYWYYRFQSYCIRFQIKFRIRWSTLIISDKPFFLCPECTLYVLSGVYIGAEMAINKIIRLTTWKRRIEKWYIYKINTLLCTRYAMKTYLNLYGNNMVLFFSNMKLIFFIHISKRFSLSWN